MRPLTVLALAACAPALAALQESAAPGFQLHALPYPGQSMIATLSDGRTVAFDGERITLHEPGGALLQVLATLPGFVYPSFVEIDPSETFAVVGESSFGDLLRVDLAGGGSTWIANVFFNFDAVFESGTRLLVSAAQGGFGSGNDVVRVDLANGSVTVLAHVDGPSGPIALDALGNLYYATQDADFPADPGSTDVLVFLASSLTGTTIVDASAALPGGSGFDGASSLVYDDEREALYLAETSYDAAQNRILQVNGGPAASTVVAQGAPGQWISGLELVTAPGGAQFAGYQPAAGGALRFVSTDFAGYAARGEVQPKRPQLGLSGPGLAGPGPFDVAVTSALPGGLALLAFGPASAALPVEVPILLGGPPIFLGLDPGALFVAPVVLALDASGAAAFHATNPGGLEHALALQALALHPGGFPAATSAVVLN